MHQNDHTTWDAVRQDLARAQQLISGGASPDALASQFREFLVQNELGLACEILADYATTHPQAAEFWLALHDAALQMGMSEQAEECQQLAEGQEPPL